MTPQRIQLPEDTCTTATLVAYRRNWRIAQLVTVVALLTLEWWWPHVEIPGGTLSEGRMLLLIIDTVCLFRAQILGLTIRLRENQ